MTDCFVFIVYLKCFILHCWLFDIFLFFRQGELANLNLVNAIQKTDSIQLEQENIFIRIGKTKIKDTVNFELLKFDTNKSFSY